MVRMCRCNQANASKVCSSSQPWYSRCANSIEDVNTADDVRGQQRSERVEAVDMQENVTAPGQEIPGDFLIQLGGQSEPMMIDSAQHQFHDVPSSQQNLVDMDSLIVPQNELGIHEIDPWFNSSLGDFLADVMMPLASPSNLDASNTSSGVPEMDLLNVGVEHGGDFDVFNFALFDTHNTVQLQSFQPMPVDDPSEPPSRGDDGSEQAIDPRRTSEAFQRSLWRFIPDKTDTGDCEQLHLSLPAGVGVTSVHIERPCPERILQSTRDKIMAMAMATCDQTQLVRIVSHFPSVDVLDCLLQDHLSYLQTRAATHIHIPTFDPNEMRSEFVAMTAACGAIRSEMAAVRKLGYALQEVVRLALPMVVSEVFLPLHKCSC